mgnify:CR=1 FL=1
MENQDKKNIILGFLSGGLVAALLLFVFIYEEPAAISAINSEGESKEKQSYPNSYYDVVLQAKAAIVYKPHSDEVLFAKNKDVQLPLASITKVMSAIVASESLPKDIKISFAESVWKLGDLLNYTLMVSSNEAATVLASAASALGYGGQQLSFINKMNIKANELGLHQTYFIDEAGLDVSDTQSGAYGSVSDVARLFKYALGNIPTSLEATTISDTWFDASGDSYPAINTNKAIGAIPGLIAGKTGYTDLAGGNLVIAYDAGLNDTTIIVVLGSTKEGRFIDVEKLVNATRQIK